jgi:hypothetical protein
MAAKIIILINIIELFTHKAPTETYIGSLLASNARRVCIALKIMPLLRNIHVACYYHFKCIFDECCKIIMKLIFTSLRYHCVSVLSSAKELWLS